ncbi:MAG: hypothetical protein O7E56_08450 [SAR324 cluster bacterium]|nr:hypothetical protein [SAR324 cluster bacterium]
MVMPTVQPNCRAWATTWSMASLPWSRRMRGTASIYSLVLKRFMPTGMLRSRK